MDTSPICEKRFTKIESALEDNGAWGIKTKVAQLWDWFISRKEKDHKIDEIDNKIDRSECDLKHEKILKGVEEILERREKEKAENEKKWKWWFEQLKWLLPTAWAFLMWVQSGGLK